MSADLATTVEQVRKLQSSIRTMVRNVRLDRYEGRNGGGDYTYQQRQVDELLPTLPHRLQGLLTAEHKLSIRLSENNDLGNPRPELRQHMKAIRNSIRTELAVNAQIKEARPS